jgi:nicotinamidase-related amidase
MGTADHGFRDDPLILKDIDNPLETMLKNLSKDTVILCGTLTNYCCGAAARQAYESDPSPLIVPPVK